MTTTAESPAVQQPQLLLTKDGRLLKPIVSKLFSTWEPAESNLFIRGEPRCSWRGKLIPPHLWEMIVSFMRASYEKHKEEALLTLFYHEETGIWDAWAFPQRPNGMTVTYLENHPKYREDRARFKTGWITAGSVHHHCSSGAFQSGPDKNDERDKDGIHITIGNLDKPIISIHCRQVFGCVMEETKPEEWILLPDWIKSIPKEYASFNAGMWLTTNHTNKFPQEWMENIYPKWESFNHTPSQRTLLGFQGPGPDGEKKIPMGTSTEPKTPGNPTMAVGIDPHAWPVRDYSVSVKIFSPAELKIELRKRFEPYDNIFKFTNAFRDFIQAQHTELTDLSFEESEMLALLSLTDTDTADALEYLKEPEREFKARSHSPLEANQRHIFLEALMMASVSQHRAKGIIEDNLMMFEYALNLR